MDYENLNYMQFKSMLTAHGYGFFSRQIGQDSLRIASVNDGDMVVDQLRLFDGTKSDGQVISDDVFAWYQSYKRDFEGDFVSSVYTYIRKKEAVIESVMNSIPSNADRQGNINVNNDRKNVKTEDVVKDNAGDMPEHKKEMDEQLPEWVKAFVDVVTELLDYQIMQAKIIEQIRMALMERNIHLVSDDYDLRHDDVMESSDVIGDDVSSNIGERNPDLTDTADNSKEQIMAGQDMTNEHGALQVLR